MIKKPKYVVITRDNQLNHNKAIKIENYCFGKVEIFKYLGVEINSHNDYHEEVRLRIKAGSRCYLVLQKTFKLQSKKSKQRLYKVLVKPVIYTRVKRDQRLTRTKKN